MARFKITFSYDGTKFNGYQKQPNLRTIQGTLEDALKYINNDKFVKVSSSGRTDAKVHANNQVCHVDIDVNITEYKLKSALNSLLPDDIHIKKTQFADEDFHARYMVSSKEYIYKINVGEYNPIERNYVYQYNKNLNIKQMKRAIKYFKGTHDFRAFTTTEYNKDSTRTIFKASIDKKGDYVIIKFIGSGFLKYMVRIMVGVLIKVGEGKIKSSYVKDIIASKDRKKAFFTASPEGLYLNKVNY